MIVTNVGGLPALVPHAKAGLVCEPNPDSIAQAMQQMMQQGTQQFLPGLQQEKTKYAWSNITNAIMQLAGLRN